jgi:hypothetical protein
LTVVTVKNPSKTLTKKTWSKKTLIVTTGLKVSGNGKKVMDVNEHDIT